jgi:hypothetical protein
MLCRFLRSAFNHASPPARETQKAAETPSASLNHFLARCRLCRSHKACPVYGHLCPVTVLKKAQIEAALAQAEKIAADDGITDVIRNQAKLVVRAMKLSLKLRAKAKKLTH